VLAPGVVVRDPKETGYARNAVSAEIEWREHVTARNSDAITGRLRPRAPAFLATW